MKKFLILISSAFISAALFSGIVAFAEDNRPQYGPEEKPAEKPAGESTPGVAGTITQKVYYSESLGIDDENKILQITSCKKKPAMAPLRCTEENASKPEYEKQCREKNTHDVREGVIIRGCRKEQPSADKPYPEVKPDGLFKPFSAGGCSDKPELQSPYYVNLWGIVKKTKDKDGKDAPPEQWIYIDSVPYESLDSEEVMKLKAVTDHGTGIDAVLQFNTTLCQPGDLDGDTLEPLETKEKLGIIAGSVADTLFGEISSDKAQIIDRESKTCKTGSLHASPFDHESSVTCSVMYYVSGKNGIEIFSQYVKYLYKWAAGIVGIVAVFTIVYNGIAISMSAGGEITEAKNRIMQSIVGLVILFLSGLILYTINPTFFTS